MRIYKKRQFIEHILLLSLASYSVVVPVEAFAFAFAFAFQPSSFSSPSSPSSPSSFSSPSNFASLGIDTRSDTGSSDQWLYSSQSSTALHSINALIEDISSSTSTSSSTSPRVVFVGGKGGVGKTTISSSLAVTLASDYSSTDKILVVSTDPAHSLGDALDVSTTLRQAHGKPVQMTDPLTMGKLYAMEIDTEAAIANFQAALSTFDVNKMSQALGVSPEMLNSFGLSDLSTLLNNPPPGLDELVALSNILNDPAIAQQFDTIVVDTAPTGHTLRMLALPDFLDSFLGKLLELRMKLSGMASMLQSFLGGGQEAQTRAQTVDDALSKLEDFRMQMNLLKDQLRNPSATDFVIVTVPTKLSVNESKRLMKELDDQNIKVSNIVINQCVVVVGSDDDDDDDTTDNDNDSSEPMINYYQRRKAGQDKWINELKTSTDEISKSPEYQSNGGGNIQLTQVPFFDVELVGTPALGYLGSTVYNNNPNFEYLLNEDDTVDTSNTSNENDISSRARFVICGGKGGVGKTTTSSSLAVTMASNGRNVALVSTDPAHSLGDVFDINFSGGNMVNVPLIGVPPSPSGSMDGSLDVLEVDPSKSLGEFKGLIDNLIGNRNKDANDDAASSSMMGGADLGKTLQELGEVFDTLPAGTDEVVALAKVVGLLKNGDYDRIVLDTAPTGHTLRMLSTPGFISELIEKVLAIAQKVNSNSMMKMMISSAAGGGGDDLDETAQAAKRALLSFQFQMYDLEDLFSNAEQTEFLIVTVPTELAVRESVRLMNDLTYEAPDMPLKVRNIVANQVLKDDGSDVTTFLNRVADGQQSSIRDLCAAAESSLGKDKVQITQVPYLDTEPRGVFGLKVLSQELLKEEGDKQVSN